MQHLGSAVVVLGLGCSAACGIFLDQGSNLCPLHWQADSYPLHHKGSPYDFYSLYRCPRPKEYFLFFPSRDCFFSYLLQTCTCLVVQLLIRVRFFVTPWTATRQASPSITISRSLLKLMSIESVMPSNHLVLCRPLLLLPSVSCCLQPSVRVFSHTPASLQINFCPRKPREEGKGLSP